jgi:ParB-like chromosome segregation protein Spo0J
MNTNPELATHPAADALPNMSDTEFQQLKDDIKEHGLREPIVLHEGRILDGRHRYRACLKLAIQPRFKQYDGNDPIAFVISMNLRRRHLGTSQRALIAAALADMKRGGDRTKAQDHALTHAAAAKLLNVGESSVDTASALKNRVEAGLVDPEVSELVRSGELSLAKAIKVARLPKDEQLVAAARNDRNATIVGTQRRKPWERQADDVVRKLGATCDKMEQISARANAASKLTIQLSAKLIEACHCGIERLEAEVRCLEARRESFSGQCRTPSSVA